jgi:glycogen operon protein
LLATLLLSVGTPMLLAGDEIGHSQRGNNNAYCQDNEISWLNWPAADAELSAFVAACSSLRARHPALRRQHWLSEADVRWLRPDASPLFGSDWDDERQHALAIWFTDAVQPLLILINADDAARQFTLPPGDWAVALRTDSPVGESAPSRQRCVNLPGRCLWALEAEAAETTPTR